MREINLIVVPDPVPYEAPEPPAPDLFLDLSEFLPNAAIGMTAEMLAEDESIRHRQRAVNQRRLKFDELSYQINQASRQIAELKADHQRYSVANMLRDLDEIILAEIRNWYLTTTQAV